VSYTNADSPSHHVTEELALIKKHIKTTRSLPGGTLRADPPRSLKLAEIIKISSPSVSVFARGSPLGVRTLILARSDSIRCYHVLRVRLKDGNRFSSTASSSIAARFGPCDSCNRKEMMAFLEGVAMPKLGDRVADKNRDPALALDDQSAISNRESNKRITFCDRPQHPNRIERSIERTPRRHY